MAIPWALSEKKNLTSVNIPLILQTSQEFYDSHRKKMLSCQPKIFISRNISGHKLILCKFFFLFPCMYLFLKWL